MHFYLQVKTTKDDIAKKELSLGTDSPVVELTGTSMMRVTYDPRLMTLIREARALSGEGVELFLPREIRDLVDRAASLAGRARALQQVATFHNTIGDRMVPSQRPLMLTIALELARAVQEQSGVVWSDPHLVDVYTARLKELVRKDCRCLFFSSINIVGETYLFMFPAGGEVCPTELGIDFEAFHLTKLRVRLIKRRCCAPRRESEHMEGDVNEHESDCRHGRFGIR